MEELQPLRLRAPVIHSAWGRPGRNSIIPALAASQETAPDELYAELWLGAHPSNPSSVVCAGQEMPLPDLLATQPALLGPYVSSRFEELPFLLKVLSVNRPLSIQLHPDREFAALLHTADPSHYPDANHKPELFIALTEVALLCGFKPDDKPEMLLQNVPELKTLVGEKGFDSVPLVLNEVLQAPAEIVAAASRALYDRLRRKEALTEEESRVLALSTCYPEGDPGIFAFFLLELLKIAPGDGLFIGPNILHCYLEGELVECMTNSDNVIRGGLTGKFKDIKALDNVLKRNAAVVRPVRLIPEEPQPGVSSYQPGLEEYCLDRFVEASLTLNTSERPQILLSLSSNACLSAGGIRFSLPFGEAYFLPAPLGGYELCVREGCVFRVRVPE